MSSGSSDRNLISLLKKENGVCYPMNKGLSKIFDQRGYRFVEVAVWARPLEGKAGIETGNVTFILISIVRSSPREEMGLRLGELDSHEHAMLLLVGMSPGTGASHIPS